MAHRFKASDLQEMIRKIVREEMSEVVKGAINEILSERYLLRLAEAAASRPRGVGRTMHIADGDDQDVEEAPRPLANTTRGIYTKHPMKHSDSVEDDEPDTSGPATTIPEGKERGEFLSTFFEGTKPEHLVEEEAGQGVQLEAIERKSREINGEEKSSSAGERRPLTQVWRELAGVGTTTRPEIPIDRAELEKLEKREEQRLKMLRESLEKRA